MIPRADWAPCIFCHCHQQQNGSGKTELSLNTAGDGGAGKAATGIKVSRKTKTRFEGYARNMTGRLKRSKEASQEASVWPKWGFHCFLHFDLTLLKFGRFQIFCNNGHHFDFYPYTEIDKKACMWLREISFHSCLIVLPGPARLLLNKICTPFSRCLEGSRSTLEMFEL